MMRIGKESDSYNSFVESRRRSLEVPRGSVFAITPASTENRAESRCALDGEFVKNSPGRSSEMRLCIWITTTKWRRRDANGSTVFSLSFVRYHTRENKLVGHKELTSCSS